MTALKAAPAAAPGAAATVRVAASTSAQALARAVASSLFLCVCAGHVFNSAFTSTMAEAWAPATAWRKATAATVAAAATLAALAAVAASGDLPTPPPTSIGTAPTLTILTPTGEGLGVTPDTFPRVLYAVCSRGDPAHLTCINPLQTTSHT